MFVMDSCLIDFNVYIYKKKTALEWMVRLSYSTFSHVCAFRSSIHMVFESMFFHFCNRFFTHSDNITSVQICVTVHLLIIFKSSAQIYATLTLWSNRERMWRFALTKTQVEAQIALSRAAPVWGDTLTISSQCTCCRFLWTIARFIAYF